MFVLEYVFMYGRMNPHISRNTEDTEIEKEHRNTSKIQNKKPCLDDFR